jgi:hypothetical protein
MENRTSDLFNALIKDGNIFIKSIMRIWMFRGLIVYLLGL